MIRLSKPIITDEEISLVTDVLKSGMLVQGKHVERFEESIKEYVGSRYSIAVSSGTAALHLALAALNINEGDAVFIPAFTFPATANVVELQRATPVLVDVEKNSYNICPDNLEMSIINWKGPEKPKAIIVVHEFGAPCNMDKIMKIAKKYNLFVIEDAACALGTKFNNLHVGTFGDIGCFSWHPRKAITTGEGGAIVTNNIELNNKIKLLRNHGIEKDNQGNIDFSLPGYNYRLTDFQAAIGNSQLSKFNEWLEQRDHLANFYIRTLNDIKELNLPEYIKGHSWQTFMVALPSDVNRKKIISNMLDHHVETNLGAQAIHMLSYYKNKYKFKDTDFPIANLLYEQGLAIPLYAGLQEKEANHVSNSLRYALMDKGF